LNLFYTGSEALLQITNQLNESCKYTIYLNTNGPIEIVQQNILVFLQQIHLITRLMESHGVPLFCLNYSTAQKHSKLNLFSSFIATTEYVKSQLIQNPLLGIISNEKQTKCLDFLFSNLKEVLTVDTTEDEIFSSNHNPMNKTVVGMIQLNANGFFRPIQWIRGLTVPSRIIQYLKTEYGSTAWAGHLDFARWLTEKWPGCTIVDLGVDQGHSTFAWGCSGTAKAVYGIDWFQGDAHTSFRNTKQIVLSTLNDMIEKLSYPSNVVHIIEGDFSTIAKTWDISIDILHIDGYHTYDAVSTDFANWSPFVNPKNGIILFHDIVAFADSVGKFFSELENRFHSIYEFIRFDHSAGLGVICFNREYADMIRNEWIQ